MYNANERKPGCARTLSTPSINIFKLQVYTRKAKFMCHTAQMSTFSSVRAILYPYSHLFKYILV